MAALYKTQGQNAQRLLAMNETLREKEEALRIESEHLRRVTDELAGLRIKVNQHNELMSEKERAMQVRPPLSSALMPLHFLRRSYTMNWLRPNWSSVSCRSVTNLS